MLWHNARLVAPTSDVRSTCDKVRASSREELWRQCLNAVLNGVNTKCSIHISTWVSESGRLRVGVNVVEVGCEVPEQNSLAEHEMNSYDHLHYILRQGIH